MNSVSWLLYLSDICDSFRTAFGPILGIGAFGIVIMWIMWVANDDGHKFFPKMWIGASISTVMWFLFLFIYIATPTRTTVLLMATSEFSSNYLVTSGTGSELSGLVTDALKLLHTQVDQALQPKDTPK